MVVVSSWSAEAGASWTKKTASAISAAASSGTRRRMFWNLYAKYGGGGGGGGGGVQARPVRARGPAMDDRCASWLAYPSFYVSETVRRPSRPARVARRRRRTVGADRR